MIQLAYAHCFGGIMIWQSCPSARIANSNHASNKTTIEMINNQQSMNKNWSKPQDNKMVAHSHPVPFSMLSMGWTHWSGNSDDSKMLDELIARRLMNGMSVLDVQIRFPCFQKYKPDNLSKNLSHQKQDMGLQSSAITTAENTGVRHDEMASPPGLHTAIPVVSPIPTTSGGTVHFTEPPQVPSAPEQASTSNARMMTSPPHVQETILPHFIVFWFDGTNEQTSIQVHLPTGLPVAFWVEEDGRTFVCQMHASRTSTDPEKSFGNFKCNNEPMYPPQHVQTIARGKGLEAWRIQ